ncbi:mesenchyme-specific cell surface glycoprotein-like [Ostrea edulis]|uniref:mesenchyme-specific cell surface glycoprotein-like n=1 Tax=Ostrea edulis TaxID=37623 RepID=UPI0024AECE73|nr:mesenchyme-specific cell surface glycoprotein-like [Ostrea edulis]
MQLINYVYVLSLLFFSCIHCGKIRLEKLSTLYIPSSYANNGAPVFSLEGGAAEQSAYDAKDKMVYIVGAAKINVIDISQVDNPRIVYHQVLGDFDPTDVEFCGDHVFVSLDNNQNREMGKLVVFKKYDVKSNTLEAVLNITVGALPDMILPTSDCRTVLIALEAEAFARDGELVDPEGGVGMLKFQSSNITTSSYSYKRLNFHHFNDRWNELSKSGVRFIHREKGNTFSQDLEPEYLSYSADERKAYVCLQENNAIAVVDLQTENITTIHGLGFKDWSQLRLDPSDKDGGIFIQSWPVHGIYQPDSIHVVNVHGVEYLVTSNEGDSKVYSGLPLSSPGFSEEICVRNLTLSANSEVQKWAIARNISNIQDDSKLGRLKVTTENGKLPDGTYDKLYTFGGRGFSIWHTDSMTKVYDSGSDIEDALAQLQPHLFNAEMQSDEIIGHTADLRSDNKGPETESSAVVHDGNKIVVFIGNERPGSISIFSFHGDMTSASLESVFWDVSDTKETWRDAFKQRSISSIDPEDIRFIPPEHSPNGQPLLLVAGAVSGTLTLLRVTGLEHQNPNIKIPVVG